MILAYKNPIYDERIIRKQKESMKEISQNIENMMLEFSKDQNEKEMNAIKTVREKNKQFSMTMRKKPTRVFSIVTTILIILIACN